MRNFSHWMLLLGAWLVVHEANAIEVKPGQQVPQSLAVRTGHDDEKSRHTMHYLLFLPENYKSDGPKMPLMLFLHGLGECGNNELEKVKIHGPASFVESRPDFPFIVVTPQCPPPKGKMEDVPKAWKADQLIQLVDHVTSKLNVDRTRVYVTGLSMGGFGTWRLVAAYPERFAAAVPICGGGEPTAMARNLSRVPIWAFHGARDAVVPLARSEEMVEAVRAAGGDVKLTVYPDVEHNSWKPTYDNPDVYDWLLSHRGPL